MGKIKVAISLVVLSILLMCELACKKSSVSNFLQPKSDTIHLTSQQAKGENTLFVHVLHHTYPIAGAWVHVKWNCTNYPGKDSTLYTFHRRCDNNGYVEFDSLLLGNYYIYGSGFDATINKSTYGYMPVVLSDATVGTDKEITVDLMVTEPH